MTLELPTFASVMAPTTLNYKDLLRICLSPKAVSCVNTGTRSVIQTLFTLHPDLLDPFCSVPCPHLLASSVQTCNSLGGRIPFGCQNYFVHKWREEEVPGSLCPVGEEALASPWLVQENGIQAPLPKSRGTTLLGWTLLSSLRERQV